MLSSLCLKHVAAAWQRVLDSPAIPPLTSELEGVCGERRIYGVIGVGRFLGYEREVMVAV